MVHYGNETAENLDICTDSGKAKLKDQCRICSGMLMIGYTMCKELKGQIWCGLNVALTALPKMFYFIDITAIWQMAAIYYFFIKESTVCFYPFIDTFNFVDVIGPSDKWVSGVTFIIATNSHYLTRTKTEEKEREKSTAWRPFCMAENSVTCFTFTNYWRRRLARYFSTCSYGTSAVKPTVSKKRTIESMFI